MEETAPEGNEVAAVIAEAEGAGAEIDTLAKIEVAKEIEAGTAVEAETGRMIGAAGTETEGTRVEVVTKRKGGVMIGIVRKKMIAERWIAQTAQATRRSKVVKKMVSEVRIIFLRKW